MNNYSVIYYNEFEILLSNEDFNNLQNVKWKVIKPDNDVYFQIHKKEYILDLYIYQEILKLTIQKDHIIEHINNNNLDNRRENLIVVYYPNQLNKNSKYNGVSFNKNNNKWLSSIIINNKIVSSCYENEIDAAYQYDLYVEKYNLYYKKNNIAKPNNITEIFKNNNYLASGIVKYKNKYKIYIDINNKKYNIEICETCETLEIAIKIKSIVENIKTKKYDLLCEIKSCNKYKNEEGNYIFIISNKEVIIDKNMYFNMYKYNWYINKEGNIRCKEYLLSRFILKCDKTLIVDYINGNILDNRKCNLRIITQKQNTINKRERINKSCKYIGVNYNYNKKKWIAEIQINDIKRYLGEFDNEIEAALIRDIATNKYYKEFGKLNFEERPTWNMYFMKMAEIVKLRSPDFCKVGAVLVSLNNNRIISTGYNSLKANMNDKNIDWTNRAFINDTVIHAEMNAIIYAQSKFEDSILYTTMSPCKACLKIISATQIKKVIYKHEYRDIKQVTELAKILNIELIEFKNDF